MQVSFAEQETHYRSAALPHFMPNSILQVLTSRPPQGLFISGMVDMKFNVLHQADHFKLEKLLSFACS
jgi:hypothetical protein